MLSATDTKQALANRAADFCRYLLPNGRKVGRESITGSLRGEAGQSCRVCVEGLKAGNFYDFATCEKGGNLVELTRQVRGCDFTEALRECEQWLSR